MRKQQKEDTMSTHAPVIDLAQWISSTEATRIISQASNRPVSYRYVRLLAQRGKIRDMKIGPNKWLYNRADVEATRVSDTPGRKPREERNP